MSSHRNAQKGWATRTLGQLAVPKGLQTGPFGSQLHASDYSVDGVPVVMPRDMVDLRVSTDQISRVPDEIAGRLARHKLRTGDLVFARRGDIGRCALITEREQGWLCGTGSLRVRIDERKADSRFLIQYLGTPKPINWLTSNAVGQTMLNLNTSILAGLPLRIPPLPEQRKIAAILNTWDQAIATVERLIAALERRKKGLMQGLLTGRLRFPEFAGSDRIVETRWGVLPIDWTLEEIGAISDINATNAEKNPAKEWYYIDLSAVDKGSITSPTERSCYKDLPSRAQRVLHQGDVLMATVRPNLLAYARFNIDADDFLCSTGFAVLTPHDLDDTEFIYQSLYSQMVQRQIHGLVTGSNYPAINASEVGKLKIAYPKRKSERRKIASVFGLVDDEMSALIRYKASLETQKKGLMQRLLTGKIRVQV